MNERLRVENLRIHEIGPVSFAAASGECLGVSGPSGSGKTLMLRAIADMESHGGYVYLDGREQAQMPAPEWRRAVALLPAESMWWFDTVGEHFSQAGSTPYGRLGFDRQVFRWPVARLSSGERQRLALLRLLANRPRIVLLDEPLPDGGELSNIIRDIDNASCACHRCGGTGKDHGLQCDECHGTGTFRETLNDEHVSRSVEALQGL